MTYHDARRAYDVTVPDPLGVFAAARTPEEALDNTQEASEAIYAGKSFVPGAHELETRPAKTDFAGDLFAYEVDRSRIQGPVVRVDVLLPQRDPRLASSTAPRAERPATRYALPCSANVSATLSLK